jgi:GR25 family glycosyltransferase involved in LPS biosynthesis
MKIFSFCIYGDDMKYYLGLRENIRLIKENFPDFHIFIYCGSNRNEEFLENIPKDSQIHFIDTGKDGSINMFYRYNPILLEDAEIVLMRDADSEINLRDQWIIRDFLDSACNTYSIQVIRDHYWHKSRITGGLTCFHLERLKTYPDVFVSLNTEFIQIFQELEENIHEFKYGSDENMLNERIWPIIKNNMVVYSNICVFKGETYKKIDYENTGENFCGNVINYSLINENIDCNEYNKTYQFNYNEYPIFKQIVWLYDETHYELVISLIEEYGFHRILFEEKPYILDYVILSIINRNTIDCIQDCFIKYQEFSKYNIIPGIKNQTTRFYNMARSLGYSIVGTCDPEYNPKEFEFVIYFGNYPDDFMSLPQSHKIYRHFLFFKDISLDRFESNHCWSNIDRIFIMGLEGEFERMHDTWMQLCLMNAPLDRIEEYRAKKDKDLNNIYIGATKNHMDCLGKMLDNSYNNCLFLEDDFIFTSRIRENQESLIEFFKRDYDYNICFISASKLHVRKEYDDLLLLSKQQCTTSSGYLVSKKNIDIVYNKVKEGYDALLENPTLSHIYCIDRYWSCLDKLYIFKKKLGYQKPSLSKITGNMNMSLD